MGAASVEGAATKLVCFVLAGQEYGAAIDDVKESMALRPITRVFLAPAWLAGVMNLRGDVVPVIDLGRFLGLPPWRESDDGRIVLARRGAVRAGLLVDALAELRAIDPAAIEPAPATLPAELAPLYRGLVSVDGALVRILDLAALFDHERLRTLDGLREA